MAIVNWKIEVGGDDSWDTMTRLLNALEGYHVRFNGAPDAVEIDATGVDGVGYWILKDGKRTGEYRVFPTAEVVTVTTL